jgi:hypothetical protein
MNLKFKPIATTGVVHKVRFFMSEEGDKPIMVDFIYNS